MEWRGWTARAQRAVAGLGVAAAVLAPAVAGFETAEASLSLPVAGALKCAHVIVDTECIRAVASNIKKRGGGVSVGGIHVTNGDGAPCPQFEYVCLHMYQDKNNLPGLQLDEVEIREYYENKGVDPPDELPVPDRLTDLRCGSISVPSDSITIASFSNTNVQGAIASHWELRIEDETGGESCFTGSF